MKFQPGGTSTAESTASPSRELGRPNSRALAVGALALGVLALGAFAIGALFIGRLAIGRARIRRLEIDELVVGTLSVTKALWVPPKSGLDVRE
jgi:hypothetical protein